jgi:hypothetical protein
MHTVLVNLVWIILHHLQKESQIYQDARTLEEFFDHLLEKWLPAYAYDSTLPSDDESDSPPQKKYRRIVLPEWHELYAASGSGVGVAQHNEHVSNMEAASDKENFMCSQ